jgi:uncharacterized membrane protein YheB (UPF0754 family)
MSLVVDKEKIELFKSGSYESHLVRVEKLIYESRHELSPSGRVTMLATFAKHAIVMNDEGVGFRLHLNESDGTLKIVVKEVIDDLKALTEEDVTSLAIKSSKEAVDLLFSDKIEESKDRIDIVLNCNNVNYGKTSTMKKFLRESADRYISDSSCFGKYLNENRFKMKKVVFGDPMAQDRIDVNQYEGKSVESNVVMTECKKNLVSIDRNIDDMKRTYFGRDEVSEKRQSALRFIEEAQDFADVAMQILRDSGDFDELKGMYEKTASYANGIELVKRYLEIA